MMRQAKKSKLLTGAISATLTVVFVFCAAFCIAFPSQAASPVPKNWECVFDASYYAANNPDVAAAFGSNESRLFQHFTQYGMKEGRRASAEFDVHYYMASYADLTAAFGSNLALYYEHYVNFGKAEGRIAGATSPTATPTASTGAGTVPGGASSAAGPSQGATLPLYVQRTATLLECAYQSYVQTKAAHYATPILPAGAIFVTEQIGEYEGASDIWKEIVYENDLYHVRASYSPQGEWSVMTYQPEMYYEEIAEKHGLSLPYATHTFTAEEIELVKSMLTSPQLLQKTNTYPWNHVFSDGGKYDTFSKYCIYGYYKGLPVRIDLTDSLARYSPDYHYLPVVGIRYFTSFDNADEFQENLEWTKKFF